MGVAQNSSPSLPFHESDLPPSDPDTLRVQETVPHLRLVVDRDRRPNTVHFEKIRDMLDVFGTGISVG